MLGQGQLKVTGVPISHIESIVEFEEDDHGSQDLGAGIERMIHRLRRLAQCDDRLEAQNLNERLWSESFCQAILVQLYAEKFIPVRESFPWLREYVEAVEGICFSNTTSESIIEKFHRQDKRLMEDLVCTCDVTTLFSCSDSRMNLHVKE
jgi:hypothetical protein